MTNNETHDSLENLFERVKSSIVCVKVNDVIGTGFLLDEKGIIVTNRHVVRGAAKPEVIFYDNKSIIGSVIYVDPRQDISFVDIKSSSMPFLKLSTKESIKICSAVVAIGHPLGLNYSITSGIISALERDIDGCPYLQTDVAINPGNSGGPLLDKKGCVVGMCTCSYKNYPGLNFAVPSYEIEQRYNVVKMKLNGKEEIKVECPNCKNENSINEKYCLNCGTVLFSIIGNNENLYVDSNQIKSNFTIALQCPNCNTSNINKNKYCPNCGTNLGKEA